MFENNDRPDIAERYATACNSSNLRVEAERGSSADVIIASGWSKSRVGGALMRLHTEYASTGKPANASETDYRLMMMGLKSLGVVLEQVTLSAGKMGIDRPQAVALAVIAHWLDDVCKSCNKLGKKRIPGTPMLSSSACNACKGTGSPLLPHGEAGRKVEEFMLYCLQCWKTSTSQGLYGRRK